MKARLLYKHMTYSMNGVLQKSIVEHAVTRGYAIDEAFRCAYF
jgi:hypothetical protein